MAQRDVESFSDFIQYYTGHYVRSRVDGKVMYMVHGPGDIEKSKATVTKFTNGKTASPPIAMGKDQVWAEMEWGLPSIGMTVFNNAELVYLYYRTARNGWRGYAMDRVIHRSFNGWILQGYGLPLVSRESLGDADNAWTALSQDWVPLGEAWDKLSVELPESLAYALSPKFGVYLGPKDLPVLCYKATEIGEVLGPTKIRLTEQNREYVDVVRRVLNPVMEIEIQ